MVMSTAEKVAQLMLAFECDNAAGSVERSVSELASIVGRERSQVCRMLKSLCQAQVLEQDPELGKFSKILDRYRRNLKSALAFGNDESL